MLTMDREGGVRAVLVTGAAKGIGRACVERLVGGGHRVYAGVRSDRDADMLRALSDRVTPLFLDVTDAAQVRLAAEQVRATLGSDTFAGVVNNAGVAVAGPLEFLPIEEMRRQFEINVIGQVAVTQALLPLIRESRGRVVNIGSVAGRSALPFMGPYSASKFALEALTDALRVELAGWGIHVTIVEPGVIATPIWDTSVNAARRMTERMPPRFFEYYGRIVDALQKKALNGTAGGLPPDHVARVVEHALFATRPKTRYVVGSKARMRIMVEKLPDRWRDRLIRKQLAKLG